MKLINCNDAKEVLYCVQKNDTLNKITQYYNIDINNIIRNNPNIDLYEGEVVKIVQQSRLQHIVKPMETLTTIAQKYNLDVDELIKCNNLTSKRLFIGQALSIDTDKTKD